MLDRIDLFEDLIKEIDFRDYSNLEILYCEREYSVYIGACRRFCEEIDVFDAIEFYKEFLEANCGDVGEIKPVTVANFIYEQLLRSVCYRLSDIVGKDSWDDLEDGDYEIIEEVIESESESLAEMFEVEFESYLR